MRLLQLLARRKLARAAGRPIRPRARPAPLPPPPPELPGPPNPPGACRAAGSYRPRHIAPASGGKGASAAAAVRAHVQAAAAANRAVADATRNGG